METVEDNCYGMYRAQKQTETACIRAQKQTETACIISDKKHVTVPAYVLQKQKYWTGL